MENSIFNNYSQQSMQFFQPLISYNQTFLRCAEKIAQAQADSIKSYAELGLNQFTEISHEDNKDLSTLFNKQSQFYGDVSKKVMDDINNMVSLGYEIGDIMFKQSQELGAQLQEASPLNKQS